MAGSAWTNQVQNQVIIAGSSGQLLVYSGTPAANNLIGSISAAGGTDSYGNVYLAGIVNYFHGVTYFALQMNAGHLLWYTAGTEAGPWTQQGEITVNQNGIMTLTANTSIALNNTVTQETFGGFIGQVPAIQTDTTTNTNANQATAQALTADYTIPAGDAQGKTIYEIEVPFDATTVAGNAIRFDLSVDDSATNTVEASFIPGSISINGFVRAYMQVITTGAGGTINAFINGAFTQNAANGTYSNSAGFAGTDRAKGVAFDTTVSHTIRINSFWPASNASQTVSGYGSKCTRSGP